MFTSKEVLERTGISRATLNNYISSGLLPRPDVLPPDPSDGSAPRIGYFPDDTIARILEIQRLKSEGWSMGRIAQHFTGGGLSSPSVPAVPLGLAVPPAAPRGAAEAVEPGGFFEEVDHPAYGLGPGFELLWANEAVQGGVVGRLLGWPSDPIRGRGILDLLLAGGRDAATDDLVGFHLLVARQRGLALETLCRGLTAAQADGVARRLQGVPAAVPGSIPVARIPAAGSERGISVHALHLRTGAVFLYAPPAVDEGRPAAAPAPAPVASPGVPAAPRLAPVAVLAARLQDAEAWWGRLPASEFVELMADLRATLDPVVVRHGGQPGLARHAGFDVLFVGGAVGDHLPRAVEAAQALREAVRVLSRRWQVRKGWTAELHLNCGLAEGHEWIAESHLLGDAAQEAAALAHAGTGGSVWATRSLVERLPASVVDGLRLAAPVAAPAWTPVDGCYARLRDLVEARGGSPTELNPRFADLSVAVLAPAAGTDHLTPQAARPPRNG